MSSSNTRMKQYRDKLRKQGLRPVQIWVLDQNSEGFCEELTRQIENLDPGDEVESLRFVAESADWSET